jgi:uncharacterized protein
VGLVAFSNYILHMLICITKCYGYGFGLSERVARTGQIEIVVVIWILQLLMPPARLAKLRYKPLEWLWRSPPTASASPSSARLKACPA